MLKRMVLVRFEDQATEDDINEFKLAIRNMAESLSMVKYVVLHDVVDLAETDQFKAGAPVAEFADFCAEWFFDDVNQLRAFLDDPLHFDLAKSVFSKVVARRFVVNCEMAM